MGKKLVPRTAKVLSETKKTKEKEAVAIAYEHIPRNPAEQQHGSIYAVIELEDKSGRAEEIAEKIIDTLYETYYSDTDKEPLAAFEESLAKINDELTSRSSEGQIDWLGKLNAVLGVLSGSTLHVTQAGKAEAYLYRNEHAMHITDGLAGDAINPQRTFINIASGDLAENDRVAIVTPGIFYKISKSELKKFATESSPKLAAKDLSLLLSGENGTTSPNSVLLMEMLSPEAFISDEASEEQTEVWVKDEVNTTDAIGTSVAGGAIKTFDYLGKAYAGTSTFIATKVVPTVKENALKVKDSYEKFRKESKAESIILESEEKISHQRPSTSTDDLEIDNNDGILESPADKIDDKTIRIKETRRKPKLLSLERFDFSIMDRAKSNLKGKGLKIRLPRGKFSYVYLGIAVALILGLVLYFGFSNKTSIANTDLENKYTQAQTLYNDSQASISSGDYQSASSDLEAATGLINELLAAGFKTTESQNLLNQINTSLDTANRITRNTSSVVNEFTEPIDAIFSNGKLIYGINYNTGAVYSFDPVASTSATIASTNNLDGKIKFATLVTSRNTLVAYTENNELYEISMSTGKATKQAVSGTLEQSAAINFFGTNIYLLSPTENQIYKHFGTATGYGKKTPYFPEAPNLENVIDIAIDGAVYTTDAMGLVNKYTSGSRDNYEVSGLPKEYTDIKGIFASVDTDGIYLFTNELVIKIDENGKFVSQYANDEAKNITNLYVSPDDKIYFLSDNKLYSI